MRYNNILFILAFLFLIISGYNCSVDIEGAPCSPEKNNCPSGQFCSKEGVCRFGKEDTGRITADADNGLSDGPEDPDIKDAGDINPDTDYENITDVYPDTVGSDVLADISDISDISDVQDISDIGDTGCINECSKGEKYCVNKEIFKECIFNANTNCYEWSPEKYCNLPPDNVCIDAVTLKVFDNAGECKVDHCEYNYKTVQCQYGCSNGKCKNCTPSCTNKQCGDDGCGGSCGLCGINAKCESNKCLCYDGYGNCDYDWTDGCETNIASDVKNCGSCGNECKVANGTTICENKVCKISGCNFPYGDCDKNYISGCEKELNSVEYCGDCDNNCTKKNWPNVSEYKCLPGFNKYYCGISLCEINYANCDGDNTNGCEVNLLKDIGNCGDCNKICDAKEMHVVSSLCNNGKCDYDKCIVGWIDDNFSRADGCETYSYFPKTYGLGNINEEAGAIVTVDGGKGGYFISGNSNSVILMVRLDVNGNIIWSKKFTDVNSVNSYFVNSAIVDVSSDGDISYIITGAVKTASSGKDLLVFKVSDTGNLQWHYVYSSLNSEEGKTVLKVNDGYLVMGNQLINNDSDILLIRLNSQGQYVWGNSYTYKNSSNPGAVESEYTFSLYPAPDGGYVAGGSTSLNNSDFLLVRFNADGSLNKAVNFGGSGSDNGKTVIPLSNGYIIGGFTNSSGKGQEDVAVMFYNNDFTGYWSNTYGDDKANILINMVPSSNGYIISGQTASSTNSYEGLLMNISKDGQNIFWQSSYGGANWDMFVNALPSYDGGFIAFGRTNSFTGGYDLWAVKTDSSGKVPGNCPSGLPSELNFVRLLFNLSITDYPMVQKTISVNAPVVPNFIITDIGINSGMQCTAP